MNTSNYPEPATAGQLLETLEEIVEEFGKDTEIQIKDENGLYRVAQPSVREYEDYENGGTYGVLIL